ncbi:hypothetical protein M0R19_06050 [Candidatus Pacearchaeota archaeon]|jgi:ribosomal protein S27AE|nr:hypothetical protein [Candidatus Pacearchaeota archaeon]
MRINKENVDRSRYKVKQGICEDDFCDICGDELIKEPIWICIWYYGTERLLNLFCKYHCKNGVEVADYIIKIQEASIPYNIYWNGLDRDKENRNIFGYKKKNSYNYFAAVSTHNYSLDNKISKDKSLNSKCLYCGYSFTKEEYKKSKYCGRCGALLEI